MLHCSSLFLLFQAEMAESSLFNKLNRVIVRLLVHERVIFHWLTCIANGTVLSPILHFPQAMNAQSGICDSLSWFRVTLFSVYFFIYGAYFWLLLKIGCSFESWLSGWLPVQIACQAFFTITRTTLSFNFSHLGCDSCQDSSAICFPFKRAVVCNSGNSCFHPRFLQSINSYRSSLCGLQKVSHLNLRKPHKSDHKFKWLIFAKI